MLRLIYIVVLSGFIMILSLGSAFEAFGFKSGISEKEVESNIKNYALGDLHRVGNSFVVNKSDNSSFVFNFCDNSLYDVAQSFPANFEKLSSFVDMTIKKFGQPMHVSALGGMGTNGFVRPINMYWKLNEKDFLRILQFDEEYTIVYETKNDCIKVPR